MCYYDNDDEGSISILKPVLVLIGMMMLLYVVTLLMGCTAPPSSTSPAAIVAPTGTDITKAGAYTDSAEAAVQAAVPHSDATGQADLGLASSAHKSVKTSLSSALTDLTGVQNTLASEEKLNDSLHTQVSTLTNSWGHKLQVYVTDAFWILVALVAVHVVAGLIAVLLPGWGIIPGIVAAVVNPFGWLTWFIAHAQPISLAAQSAEKKIL
jgi:hypothetical protein